MWSHDQPGISERSNLLVHRERARHDNVKSAPAKFSDKRAFVAHYARWRIRPRHVELPAIRRQRIVDFRAYSRKCPMACFGPAECCLPTQELAVLDAVEEILPAWIVENNAPHAGVAQHLQRFFL